MDSKLFLFFGLYLVLKIVFFLRIFYSFKAALIFEVFLRLLIRGNNFLSSKIPLFLLISKPYSPSLFEGFLGG
jgi:hypothetical protein